MRKLMSPPDFISEPEQTKSKIMIEAVHMFALKGYRSVTVREIATAIGLQSGSIYNYFLSKQEIMENIMELAEKDLLGFYSMLDRLSEEAESFRQLLEILFVESVYMANPFAFYAFYCAMHNQFEIECCRHVYYDIYFKEGHQMVRRQLETAIRRGLVKPFSVPEVASLITNCFVTMISFSVAHFNGYYEDFDAKEWYGRQINHILRATGELGAENRQGEEL